MSSSQQSESELSKRCIVQEHQMNRVRELDGLRGIAILMVLTWHYIHSQADGVTNVRLLSKLRVVTGEFWSGVDLFFVLSGFLIAGVLVDNIDSKHLLRTFWIRRFCRILPVYVILLAAYFLSSSLRDESGYNWLFGERCPDWCYFLFVQNLWMASSGEWGGNFLAVTWSLAVEEQFYLILPLLFLGLGTRSVGIVAFGCVLLAPALRSISSPLGAYVLMFCRMDALFSGVIVALLVKRRLFVSPSVGERIVLGVVLLIGVFVIALDRSVGFLGSFKYSFYSVVYATLLLEVYLLRSHFIVGLFRSPFLTVFGKYSFGLYMYHQAIAGLLHGLVLRKPPSIESLEGVSVTLVALLVTAAVSIASFHFVERRFVALGRTFEYL